MSKKFILIGITIILIITGCAPVSVEPVTTTIIVTPTSEVGPIPDTPTVPLKTPTQFPFPTAEPTQTAEPTPTLSPEQIQRLIMDQFVNDPLYDQFIRGNQIPEQAVTASYNEYLGVDGESFAVVNVKVDPNNLSEKQKVLDISQKDYLVVKTEDGKTEFKLLPANLQLETFSKSAVEFTLIKEYQQGFQDYLKAMGLAFENVSMYEEKIIVNNLEYHFIMANPNHERLPSTLKKYSKLYKEISLFRYHEKNGLWNKVNLRDFADLNKIKLGSEYRLVPRFFEEINEVVVGVYWKGINPAPNKYNFKNLDSLVNSLKEKGVSMRGHALVFPAADYAMPQWLKESNFSKEELESILVNHIKTVISHGKELGIKEWVVVNEPYLRPGLRDDDIFYKTFGNYDYIEIAFRAAREADPEATLIYNDTDNHSSTGLTTALTQRIVDDLKAKGLVDVVGVQGHIGDWVQVPNMTDVTNTLNKYDLPIAITEFDFNLSDLNKTQDELYLYQAEVYRDFFTAAFTTGNLHAFTFWGISDRNSWLTVDLGQEDADPTIFDKNHKPKASYYALIQVLYEIFRFQSK